MWYSSGSSDENRVCVIVLILLILVTIFIGLSAKSFSPQSTAPRVSTGAAREIVGATVLPPDLPMTPNGVIPGYFVTPNALCVLAKVPNWYVENASAQPAPSPGATTTGGGLNYAWKSVFQPVGNCADDTLPTGAQAISWTSSKGGVPSLNVQLSTTKTLSNTPSVTAVVPDPLAFDVFVYTIGKSSSKVQSMIVPYPFSSTGGQGPAPTIEVGQVAVKVVNLVPGLVLTANYYIKASDVGNFQQIAANVPYGEACCFVSIPQPTDRSLLNFRDETRARNDGQVILRVNLYDMFQTYAPKALQPDGYQYLTIVFDEVNGSYEALLFDSTDYIRNVA